MRNQRNQRNQRKQRGYQLVELVVLLAVLAALLTVGLPSLLRLSTGVRLMLVAAEMEGVLGCARSEAVKLGTEVAVKFRPRPDGTATWSLYRDGNGNGVLNKDITSGADPEVVAPHPVEGLGRRLRFGFALQPARDPGNSGQLLRAGDDPIRFNTSDLASFGPLGTSTPGSLYLTDGESRLMAVRVYGRTGKVKVIVYDFREEVWK